MNKYTIIAIVAVFVVAFFTFKDNIKNAVSEVVGDTYNLQDKLANIKASYTKKLANANLTDAEKIALQKQYDAAVKDAEKIATLRQQFLSLFGSQAPMYYTSLQLQTVIDNKKSEKLAAARTEYLKQVGTQAPYSYRTAEEVHSAIDLWKALTKKQEIDNQKIAAWTVRKRELDNIANEWFREPKNAVITMEHLSSRDITYTLRTIEARYKRLSYSNAFAKLRNEIRERTAGIFYSSRTKNAARNVLADYEEISKRDWQLSNITATGDLKVNNYIPL